MADALDRVLYQPGLAARMAICLTAGGGGPALARGRRNLPFPHRRGIAGAGGGVIETVVRLPSLRHWPIVRCKWDL